MLTRRLPRRQAEPDRKPLGIDDRVDLGRETAPESDRDNDLDSPFRGRSLLMRAELDPFIDQ